MFDDMTPFRVISRVCIPKMLRRHLHLSFVIPLLSWWAEWTVAMSCLSLHSNFFESLIFVASTWISCFFCIWWNLLGIPAIPIESSIFLASIRMVLGLTTSQVSWRSNQLLSIAPKKMEEYMINHYFSGFYFSIFFGLAIYIYVCIYICIHIYIYIYTCNFSWYVFLP